MQYHVNSNSFQNHSLHILCVRTKSWVIFNREKGEKKEEEIEEGGEERRGDHQQGPTPYILSQNIPGQ